MKVALELNDNNVIKSYVYLAHQNYSLLLENDNRFTLANVENIEEIIEYKTKYEDGKIIQLEDYTQEYYDIQNKEEQRFVLEMQLNELYSWFNEYDNQVKQYERDVRLDIVGTYHIGDNEYTIAELDNLARQKASQITEIRQQIKNLE